jgi:hypothetical protein
LGNDLYSRAVVGITWGCSIFSDTGFDFEHLFDEKSTKAIKEMIMI